jgi:outer membrane lipoprotein-sorting protein
MTKKILILLVIFILNTTNLFASTKENIILNFKKIQNISFKFKQTIGEKTEEGNCIIQYPKKIYCIYNNYKKKIIISNGKTLFIKNQNNNQYYRYSLKKTPLDLILNKDLLIEKMLDLNGKLIDDKYYNFSIKINDNKINIFFDKKSYDLIGWQTEDIYQNLVITFIYNIEKNKKIDEKLFKLPELN